MDLKVRAENRPEMIYHPKNIADYQSILTVYRMEFGMQETKFL